MAYDRKLGGWRGPVTHLDNLGQANLGQAAAGQASGAQANRDQASTRNANRGSASRDGANRDGANGNSADGAGANGNGDWTAALAKVARPAGMLPDWRLGVVLSRIGQRGEAGLAGAARRSPASRRVPQTGMLSLADVAWARPVKDGKPGPAPHKMADVVQPGDVVMVQPLRIRGCCPARRIGQPIQLGLRQIPQVQGALVSLDPTTGRVLAMVGGWSFEQSQFNRPPRRSASRAPASSRSSI